MQRGLESLCSVSKPSIKVAERERGEMVKIDQKCSNLPAPSVCNIVTSCFHVFCDDMRTLVDSRVGPSPVSDLSSRILHLIPCVSLCVWAVAGTTVRMWGAHGPAIGSWIFSPCDCVSSACGRGLFKYLCLSKVGLL